MLILRCNCVRNYNMLLKPNIINRIFSINCLEINQKRLFIGICSTKFYFPYFNSWYIIQYKRYCEKVLEETKYNIDKTENQDKTIKRKNVDTRNIPVSFLGTGFIDKKIRLINRALRKNPKELTNEDDDDDDNDLPIALQLKSSQISHPELTFSHVRKNNLDEVKNKSSVIQYPYKEITSEQEKLQNLNTNNVQNKSQVYFDNLSPIDNELRKKISVLREDLWDSNYGSPDPSLPVSDVPCGGCGALLHCKNSSLPGYMPSEKFKLFLSKLWKLRGEICQRCLYLKHFNVALNVTVDPSDYPNIISNIKDKNSLVILIIDLTDFPCSIWSNITDIIGDKPIFIVGNKVDLLPCKDDKELNHVVNTIKQTLKYIGIDRGGNIKHIGLISAKTGYGIEQLINKLHKIWDNKGDVYLVGCTNVGKSTLFNRLLESDYCKVRAIDLIQRATISPWPGTTLNLLKFPILRTNHKRLYLRTKRLIEQRKEESLNKKIKKHLLKETKDPNYATLVGNVGMTFKSEYIKKVNDRKIVFDDRSYEFVHGNFCFDTPGAVYHDQILNFLTVEELMQTLPKKIIVPRSYWIRVSQALFLAGLARVDLVEAHNLGGICITVFASDDLPVHMVYQDQAEKFYNHYLGTEMLRVPRGDSNRLKDFPALISKEFSVTGHGWKESSVDILLSSAGWIAVTLKHEHTCKLKVYTPEGRGCYLREPSLLPHAVNMKGKRIKATPAYEIKFN